MYCDHTGESQQVAKQRHTRIPCLFRILYIPYYDQVFVSAYSVNPCLMRPLRPLDYRDRLRLRHTYKPQQLWLGLPLHRVVSITNHTPNRLLLDCVLSILHHCSFTVFFACVHPPFGVCSPSVLRSTKTKLFDELCCASAFTNSCGIPFCSNLFCTVSFSSVSVLIVVELTRSTLTYARLLILFLIISSSPNRGVLVLMINFGCSSGLT